MSLKFDGEEVEQTFVEELKKIANTDPETFVAELEKASTLGETRQFFTDEVKGLCKTITETRNIFDTVREKLEDFDAQDFRHVNQDGSSGGELLPKLAPHWLLFSEVGYGVPQSLSAC